MSKKTKAPTLLYVIRDAEGTLLCDTSYEGMNDGDDVAIYRLVKIAKVTTSVALKDIEDVSTDAVEDVTKPDSLDICSACGHTRKWHGIHRPRHVFVLKKGTRSIEDMHHHELVDLARDLGLKLNTRGMHTKVLRRTLLEHTKHH